jgi:hypothetical protein
MTRLMAFVPYYKAERDRAENALDDIGGILQDDKKTPCEQNDAILDRLIKHYGRDQ